MKPIRSWILRLAGSLASDRRERELADELEGHPQMHVVDNLRAGMVCKRPTILHRLGSHERKIEVTCYELRSAA